MTHTPGPWAGINDTVGSDYGDIARIHYQSSRAAKGWDDRSLIAAAPEMLIVLRRVIDMANCAMDYVGVDDAHTLKRALERISKAKRECERVIEKAEGSDT